MVSHAIQFLFLKLTCHACPPIEKLFIIPQYLLNPQNFPIKLQKRWHYKAVSFEIDDLLSYKYCVKIVKYMFNLINCLNKDCTIKLINLQLSTNNYLVLCFPLCCYFLIFIILLSSRLFFFNIKMQRNIWMIEKTLILRVLVNLTDTWNGFQRSVII